MKQIDVTEWQLIIDNISHEKISKILLLFRYVKSDLTSNEILEKTIQNYLQKCFEKPLSTLSEELTLQFESIQFNELIRNKTSNKLLKIIDKRL
ncbi:unnamed protein product [Adineta steineri]|uniref:Uncharacterized protein n=2 Tax=Adineta steineri TaxID=433720 RepID=A0A813YA96_9BILA|nr:unnamed protein product [Adineta steineri]